MTVNRILTDKDREELQPEIDLMNKAVPEMMGRKIQDAVVQQAFVLNSVIYGFAKRFQQEHGRLPTVLSAGSYEDTAGETLKHLGYEVTDVDPVLNTDLHTFALNSDRKFDVVISTSVLEHTDNWQQFVEDICDLLLPNGLAVLTCDFKNDWNPGDRLPTTSNRFFTSSTILNELKTILEISGCSFVDTPNYSGHDRFSWEGINYSFATIVFRKV